MGSERRRSRFGDVMKERAVRVAVLCLAVPALMGSAACRPSGPLKVTNVQTGRSLNSDNTVGNHTTRFRPDDTMYVAVITAGPGAGTIAARWTYSGRLVSEETRQVAYRDGGATEFHIQNSGGFPNGSYAVEIIIDGKTFVTRPLTVER